MSGSGFSHLDDQGRARMVDVGDKAVTERTATATCDVVMAADTLARIRDGGLAKGDVLTVARLAGIMGAKRTPDLIPLCHPLQLSNVEVELDLIDDRHAVVVAATCRIAAKTGVEMEALTAASVAALTVYDMCKAVDKAMRIDNLRVTHKSGGRSGTHEAP